MGVVPVTLLAFLLQVPPPAPPSRTCESPLAGEDSIDAFVARSLVAYRVPGVSVAVTRHGRLLKACGYGSADLEQGTPASPETVYEIGSVTKILTSMLVAELISDGRLRLADTLGAYLTGIPRVWQSITIQQLLTHTSGIPNYSGGDYLALFRTEHSVGEILGLVADQALEFAPGLGWDYSNTNYYILGLVIERVTGSPYWAALRERLLNPLHLDHTGPSSPDSIIPRRARGYRLAGERLLNVDPLTPSSSFAAGGVVSTVLDFVRLDQAMEDPHFAAATGVREITDIARALADSGPGASHAPGLRTYGVEIGSAYGRPWIGHRGTTAGQSAMFLKVLDADVSVIVFGNLYGGYAFNIAIGVADRVSPGLLLRSRPTAPDSDSELSIRTRGVITDFGAGSHELTLFALQLRQALSPPNYAYASTHFRGIRSWTFLSEDRVSGNGVTRFGLEIARIRNYRLVTGTETTYLTLYFTAENLIADYDVQLD